MSAKDFMLRYATPLTTGLFIVSLVSGVALFLHVGTQYFREMHELLSMVLIVPFVLHMWRNWGPLKNYFKRVPMYAGLAVCLIMAAPFAIEGASSTGTDPRMAAFGALQDAEVSTLALVAKTDEATIIKRLEAAGVSGATGADTLTGLAAKAGANAFELVGAVFTAGSPSE
ncbi:DUF4405 domain-containing protein [Oryzibacter oryziterrae]|uniref:DUF4405 domain-containing protein n=1 Tax=Oryzibacter oryziterrae TaxID=2766474 RepID=UPI001F480B4C|nr:DUF4405 domain-containing protein [Oryzibacter oryziterrae]